MGHYLSDFETDDEWRNRTIYQPMCNKLREYDAERKRGLVHTDEWVAEMEANREKLRERGWNV